MVTTREALAMALNDFEGTLMLVSHDRALLRSVCDEFWLVGRGGIAPFDGDLDDYQRYLLDEAKRLRELVREESRSPAISASAAPKTATAPAPSSPTKNATTKIAEGAYPKGAGGQNSSQNASEQRKLDAQRRQQSAQRNKPLQRELGDIEARMAALNVEKAAVEVTLLGPANAQAIAQAGKRLKAIQNELDLLEERWLALGEQMESSTA